MFLNENQYFFRNEKPGFETPGAGIYELYIRERVFLIWGTMRYRVGEGGVTRAPGKYTKNTTNEKHTPNSEK